jgi:hypothetical protein
MKRIRLLIAGTTLGVVGLLGIATTTPAATAAVTAATHATYSSSAATYIPTAQLPLSVRMWLHRA